MYGIKLKNKKELTKNKKLLYFSRPKYIYIPLIVGNDTNITTIVKKGDYIYKGSIVGKSKGKIKLPIHSSISGTVIDFVVRDKNDESIKYIMIENDYKEKTEQKQVTKRKINSYTKYEFLQILQDCGIVGMGGSGFPTYIKYNTNKKIHTLIVNAVECEPYITADYILTKEKCEEVLESIDAILEINGIREAYIAIKKYNEKLIKLFDNYLGTYPRIKIITVPDFYPMGWEKNLVNYVKKVDYNKLPLERGIVVNNISTIYAIYEALKYKKPLIERIITFSGEGLKHPQNVYVKIGTNVSDIIEAIEGVKNEDIIYVEGGPMMGIGTPLNELITTKTMNSILVLPKKTNHRITNCMRCGKCVEHCPSKLSPVIIRDNLNKIDYLKTLKVDRCIECGMCSYICPAKLNIREDVRMAKKSIIDDDERKDS